MTGDNPQIGVFGEALPNGDVPIILNEEGRRIYGENTKLFVRPENEERPPDAEVHRRGRYAIEIRSDGQMIRFEGPTAEEVLRLSGMYDMEDRDA